MRWYDESEVLRSPSLQIECHVAVWPSVRNVKGGDLCVKDSGWLVAQKLSSSSCKFLENDHESAPSGNASVTRGLSQPDVCYSVWCRVSDWLIHRRINLVSGWCHESDCCKGGVSASGNVLATFRDYSKVFLYAFKWQGPNRLQGEGEIRLCPWMLLLVLSCLTCLRLIYLNRDCEVSREWLCLGDHKSSFLWGIAILVFFLIPCRLERRRGNLHKPRNSGLVTGTWLTHPKPSQSLSWHIFSGLTAPMLGLIWIRHRNRWEVFWQNRRKMQSGKIVLD